MQNPDSHLSDEDLALAAGGELPAGRMAGTRTHLSLCAACRARRQEMEDALAGLERLHRNLDLLLPPAEGPRALLKARLAELRTVPDHGRFRRQPLALGLAAACAVLALAILIPGLRSTHQPARSSHAIPVYAPSARLTPGAARPVGREEICRADLPNNRVVPAAMQRKVFEAYGLSDADPQAYEVDYLITPALGGADDIRNLWPQSYASTVWNARVKDALEDRLHDLVCRQELDLVTAQHEIAGDWIAAYKKYFHADAPPAR